MSRRDTEARPAAEARVSPGQVAVLWLGVVAFFLSLFDGLRRAVPHRRAICLSVCGLALLRIRVRSRGA